MKYGILIVPNYPSNEVWYTILPLVSLSN